MAATGLAPPVDSVEKSKTKFIVGMSLGLGAAMFLVLLLLRQYYCKKASVRDDDKCVASNPPPHVSAVELSTFATQATEKPVVLAEGATGKLKRVGKQVGRKKRVLRRLAELRGVPMTAAELGPSSPTPAHLPPLRGVFTHQPSMGTLSGFIKEDADRIAQTMKHEEALEAESQMEKVRLARTYHRSISRATHFRARSVGVPLAAFDVAADHGSDGGASTADQLAKQAEDIHASMKAFEMDEYQRQQAVLQAQRDAFRASAEVQRAHQRKSLHSTLRTVAIHAQEQAIHDERDRILNERHGLKPERSPYDDEAASAMVRSKPKLRVLAAPEASQMHALANKAKANLKEKPQWNDRF